MAAGLTAWEIPQKSVWAVTSNNLGPTLALCPCICIFPRFKLYFQLLSLSSSVVSLHALRSSVCWEKAKQMKLKIQSLTLHKERITADGNVQAALRVCSLGWIRVWTLSCWGQTSWVLRAGGSLLLAGLGKSRQCSPCPREVAAGTPLCKGLGVLPSAITPDSYQACLGLLNIVFAALEFAGEAQGLCALLQVSCWRNIPDFSHW